MALLCTSSLHRVVVPMDVGFLVLSQSCLSAAVVLLVVVAFLLSSFVVTLSHLSKVLAVPGSDCLDVGIDPLLSLLRRSLL